MLYKKDKDIRASALAGIDADRVRADTFIVTELSPFSEMLHKTIADEQRCENYAAEERALKAAYKTLIGTLDKIPWLGEGLFGEIARKHHLEIMSESELVNDWTLTEYISPNTGVSVWAYCHEIDGADSVAVEGYYSKRKLSDAEAALLILYGVYRPDTSED